MKKDKSVNLHIWEFKILTNLKNVNKHHQQPISVNTKHVIDYLFKTTRLVSSDLYLTSNKNWFIVIS